MGKLVKMAKNLNHEVSETICIRCHKRYIMVRPYGTLLQDLECENCGAGYIVNTGESMKRLEEVFNIETEKTEEIKSEE